MKATIKSANQKKALFVFSSEGEYGYFELLGGEDLNVGNVLIGDFSTLGSTSVKNQDSNEEVEIIIEDFCSLQSALDVINRD